jgi:hypothetical protein
MHTLRLADPATTRAYPLAVAGPARWAATSDGVAVEIELPDLPAGTLLVPSLALADRAAGYHQWMLAAEGACWPLPPVPSRPPRDAAGGTPTDPARDPRVSLHIDCWHVHADLVAPRVRVTLRAGAAPSRYLVAVSARPLSLPDAAAPRASGALPRPPPALSQMTAPPELAPRICSPTSVAMVLGHWGETDPWLAIVEECRDPATGMYGVWPLAVAAAARRGRIGAVEVFAGWDEPLAVLERGIPLVTSIRFERGSLPGAPLERSAGHLVVLFAAGPDTVVVNDPAAPDAASVTRTYAAAAFSAAWLGSRGAAYILPP